MGFVTFFDVCTMQIWSIFSAATLERTMPLEISQDRNPISINQ